jgi:predicted RNase H-like HicB family nuclease
MREASMTLKYTVLMTYVPEDRAFIANVPLLEIETSAETEAGLWEAVREAIELDLIVRADRGEPIPVEPDGFASIGEVDIEMFSLDDVIGIEGHEGRVRKTLESAIAAGGRGKRKGGRNAKSLSAARH